MPATSTRSTESPDHVERRDAMRVGGFGREGWCFFNTNNMIDNITVHLFNVLVGFGSEILPVCFSYLPKKNIIINFSSWLIYEGDQFRRIFFNCLKI